ncbi:MAG: hypothetical protein JHC54_15560 [Acinetobacter sp.]|nr:hypothetical protein [Acinetobacter sp.]
MLHRQLSGEFQQLFMGQLAQIRQHLHDHSMPDTIRFRLPDLLWNIVPYVVEF